MLKQTEGEVKPEAHNDAATATAATAATTTTTTTTNIKN